MRSWTEAGISETFWQRIPSQFAGIQQTAKQYEVDIVNQRPDKNENNLKTPVTWGRFRTNYVRVDVFLSGTFSLATRILVVWGEDDGHVNKSLQPCSRKVQLKMKKTAHLPSICRQSLCNWCMGQSSQTTWCLAFWWKAESKAFFRVCMMSKTWNKNEYAETVESENIIPSKFQRSTPIKSALNRFPFIFEIIASIGCETQFKSFLCLQTFRDPFIASVSLLCLRNHNLQKDDC